MLRILFTILLLSFSSAHGQELKTITPESFLAENPSPERKEIIDFMVHQFDGKTVTQAQLDKLWHDIKARHRLDLSRFQIVNQKLYADSANEVYPISHFRALSEHLLKLLIIYKIEDVDFILYNGDDIKYPKEITIPFFAMSKNSKSPDEKAILLLPDALMIKKPWENLTSTIREANSNNNWNNKINKIYWRGSTTGGEEDAYQLKNFDKLPRLSLVMLSKLYPELIDAEFSNYINYSLKNDDNLRFILETLSKNNTKKTNEIDHLKYKYLIAIDGYTCAWQRVPWIMLSNSVLVKQETSNIEWFYPALKPYINYIPVNEQLTNIFEQIKWMKNHDKELQQISLNAQNFISNNLLPEHINAHTAIILNEYHKIQQDTKIIPSLPLMRPEEEARSFINVTKLILRRIVNNLIIWIKSW